MRTVILALSLSFAAMYGQTQQIAVVSSSYPVTLPASSTLTFGSENLGVSYPAGLAPGSYILGTQLNTDFQGFLSAYPSPTDPPEAILSTVLQSILNKYSQMIGGTIIAELPGAPTTIGTITIPNPTGGGSVVVEIGTFSSTLGGLAARQPHKPTPIPVKPNPVQ